MADFAAWFPTANPYLDWQPAADPIDNPAIIMPLTTAGDNTPPALATTPIVPGPVEKDEPIEISVEDIVSELASVVIMAFWPGAYEVIFDGEDFSEGYNELSTVDYIPDLPAPSVTMEFVIRRNLGWPVPLPPGEQLEIKVVAVDKSGQVTT